MRLAVGLPLMFYLPGFAILQVAFGLKSPGRGGMTFAVGLSIVVTVFCGFALYVLGVMAREG